MATSKAAERLLAHHVRLGDVTIVKNLLSLVGRRLSSQEVDDLVDALLKNNNLPGAVDALRLGPAAAKTINDVVTGAALGGDLESAQKAAQLVSRTLTSREGRLIVDYYLSHNRLVEAEEAARACNIILSAKEYEKIINICVANGWIGPALRISDNRKYNLTLAKKKLCLRKALDEWWYNAVLEIPVNKLPSVLRAMVINSMVKTGSLETIQRAKNLGYTFTPRQADALINAILGMCNSFNCTAPRALAAAELGATLSGWDRIVRHFLERHGDVISAFEAAKKGSSQEIKEELVSLAVDSENIHSAFEAADLAGRVLTEQELQTFADKIGVK